MNRSGGDQGLREARLLLGVAGFSMREAVRVRHALGSEEAFLRGNRAQLQHAGLKSRAAERICAVRERGDHLREEERAERSGSRVRVFGFPGFPERLEEIPDAPAVLFTRGTLPSREAPAVAIVGSRRCSPEGRRLAAAFGHEMAAQGISVVSGLARGIDGAAMRGCLDGGGTAIGVLGCGLDLIYPPDNQKLFEDTVRRGAVVSEFPLGTPPHKRNFPRRNRIISGFSIGLLVMEASEKSGSLITVDHALQQDRTVMAVPGPVGPSFFRGSNLLIRDGACVVLQPEDVYAALNLPYKDRGGDRPPREAPRDPAEERILELCQHRALTVEEFIERMQKSPGEVLVLLSRLETEGVVEREPGARFICRRPPQRARAKA